MDHQSKQGQGQGHGKRKKDEEASASGGNGASNGNDFPEELAGKAKAAFEAAKQSVEKGIDAWKKIVASAPGEWAPRRELAILYQQAERWNAFIEVTKEGVEKAKWSAPEDKIPVLLDMIEVYRDRLKLDVMVVNAFNQILTIQPSNFEAADKLAAQYEAMKRWPDLISLLRKKASVAETPAEKVALHLRVANLFLEKFSNQAEAIKAYESILELDPDNSDALVVRQADVREASRLGEADRGQPARDRQAHRRRRAKGPPHRGGQARLREDEEARGLDRPVGARCSPTIRRTWRRSASSRSSTSARRPGASSAACSNARWLPPPTPYASRRSG